MEIKMTMKMLKLQLNRAKVKENYAQEKKIRINTHITYLEFKNFLDLIILNILFYT
jgi:hypothetical protein